MPLTLIGLIKLLLEYRRHFLIVAFPAFLALIDFIDFRSFQAILVVPRTPSSVNFCVPSFDRRPTAQFATTRKILQFVAAKSVSSLFPRLRPLVPTRRGGNSRNQSF